MKTERYTIRRLGPAEHYSIDTTEGEQVAVTACGEGTLERARLFVMAPEMLEMLERLEHYLNMPARYDKVQSAHLWTQLNKVIDNAKEGRMGEL